MRAFLSGGWLCLVLALIAQQLWGPVGFLIGGLGGLVLSLAASDLLDGRSLGEGFVLRHRAGILSIALAFLAGVGLGPKLTPLLQLLLPSSLAGLAGFFGFVIPYFAGLHLST